MTLKLFWNDPYQTSCNATITKIQGNQVWLDQTCFYAFSGGQESDAGTIGGITVKNAVKQGDKETIIDIAYELEDTPNFKEGGRVEVVIDKSRRACLRNLHSATHLLYYILSEEVGKPKIIGSHVSQEKARIDFSHETPLTEVLPRIQERVNEFIAEGHDIKMLDDREKPDLRWWSCSNWKMPCGGTHPNNTTEIGPLLLKRKNIGKGKERVEIFLQYHL